MSEIDRKPHESMSHRTLKTVWFGHFAGFRHFGPLLGKRKTRFVLGSYWASFWASLNWPRTSTHFTTGHQLLHAHLACQGRHFLKVEAGWRHFGESYSQLSGSKWGQNTCMQNISPLTLLSMIFWRSREENITRVLNSAMKMSFPNSIRSMYARDTARPRWPKIRCLRYDISSVPENRAKPIPVPLKWPPLRCTLIIWARLAGVVFLRLSL